MSTRHLVVAFDLDGTLSDPLVGVARSINYALERLGHPARDQDFLAAYIGPPLTEIFSDLFGTTDAALVRKAIDLFRERYSRIGYRENVLYPGITELLTRLSGTACRLYLATNKKESIARSVVDHFSIAGCFRQVLGAGGGRTKTDLLETIQAREPGASFVMVGDRRHDVEAGRAAGFDTIGVLWGYGSRTELLDAGVGTLCETPEALGRCLLGFS